MRVRSCAIPSSRLLAHSVKVYSQIGVVLPFLSQEDGQGIRQAGVALALIIKIDLGGRTPVVESVEVIQVAIAENPVESPPIGQKDLRNLIGPFSPFVPGTVSITAVGMTKDLDRSWLVDDAPVEGTLTSAICASPMGSGLGLPQSGFSVLSVSQITTLSADPSLSISTGGS